MCQTNRILWSPETQREGIDVGHVRVIDPITGDELPPNPNLGNDKGLVTREDAERLASLFQTPLEVEGDAAETAQFETCIYRTFICCGIGSEPTSFFELIDRHGFSFTNAVRLAEALLQTTDDQELAVGGDGIPKQLTGTLMEAEERESFKVLDRDKLELVLAEAKAGQLPNLDGSLA